MMNLLKKKTIIFLLSDFFDAGFEKPLIGLSKKHEVIPIAVNDLMEERLRIKGGGRLPVLIDVEDIETGETRTIDLSEQRFSEIARYRDYYRKVFAKLSLDYTEINDSMDYFKKIELLLRRRAHKR